MSASQTPSTAAEPTGSGSGSGSEWWRTAVIYQVYPRSFADADGDGMGDLPGITSRLDALAELGVDAVWLSPFYPSPQRDAGYDVSDYCDVDPLFGTLEDADALISRAHELGLKVIADLVPNHTSNEHPWFRAALEAEEGSRERGHYLFRDGRGERGDEPPNDWQSVFGGGAWTRVMRPDGTPGQWYLHLFDESQPDLDWSDEDVREAFRRVLRFWLDRGIDGFRIDVAHGMVKAPGLPDWVQPEPDGAMAGMSADGSAGASPSPYWAQEGVHDINRDWRAVLDEYPGERILVAEAWVEPLSALAHWVRPDEMHQAFNFPFLETPWDAGALIETIADSLAAFGGVGAPSTWVLSNHDVIRHATRLALPRELQRGGGGIGPRTEGLPDRLAALARGRAATTLMLALPGSAYLYQGEELGLPEVVDIPDEDREDPTFLRTGGERYGRDGCRVPIPWAADEPAYGFNATGETWLPQPDVWHELARDVEGDARASTLALYRLLLALRAERGLGSGELTWVDGMPEHVVAFANSGVTVLANTGEDAVALPDGEILAASGPVADRMLPPDTTVWLG